VLKGFGAYLGRYHTGWWADAFQVFHFSCGEKLLSAQQGGMIVTPHQQLFEKIGMAHPSIHTVSGGIVPEGQQTNWL